MFTLRLTNLDQVRRAHSHFLAECERMLQEAAELAGKHSVDHVQKYPAFKPRSGDLQRGQRYMVRRTKSGRLLYIYNDVKYANPIDKGSKPHRIPAKNAKALRFAWPKFWSIQTRSPIWYLKSVNHPGNRPYKFAYRAWRSAYRVEGQILARRMTELASRF